MPRDAAATRTRILAAAVAEFAAHGLAGGRIERICTAAATNPRMVYVHFGNKEGLFDAVVEHVLGQIGVEVPLTENDLPGFAGRRFDQLLAHPEAVRINLWRFLERPSAGPDDTQLYQAKVAALHVTLTFSDARPVLSPADLLILIPNMAAAWVSTSRDLLGADRTDPDTAERQARHRAALVEAVRILVEHAGSRPLPAS